MSDLIARFAACLVDAGVDRAFGVSGSGPSYQLISALKARGVHYVPVSHEAVGPVAAGAYGWLTGRRAAAISIKGPGLANMMAGMCSAYFEGYAPICIAENYDDSVAIERAHKRLNQHAIVSSVVDGIYSLNDLERLPAILSDHRHATRPLYIDLSKTASPNPRVQHDPPPHGDDGDRLAEFEARLATAERVVVIVGAQAKRRSWKPLIDRLTVPVFTTTQAKGTVDELQPNAAGIYTGVGKSLAPETSLLPLADLVVTFGLRNMEILGVAGKPGFVNFDVPHPAVTASDWIVDDAIVRRVMAKLADKRAWGLDVIERHRAQWRDYVAEYEWMPGQVFAALDALESPHTLVLDTGTFCTVGEHVWQARPGRDFLGSSNGRNLGIGVPHALGAASARPGTPVFCALGDGGIRYYLADLRTMAEKGWPVCFILMKDGRYGSISCNVPAPADPDIVEPLGVSWLEPIRAMGIAAGLADSASSFQRLLDGWDRATPFFIEAAFDPEIYLHVADAIRG